MATDFAHLHVHSEYSLLDGFSRIKKLVQQTKAQGMNHLAITDHGAMYGAIEFYKACKAGGINPVIGIEAYLTADMKDHSKRFSDDYHHLLMIAKNNTGYNNLMRLTTIAHTEGWHLRPRMDKKVLEKYAEGIIVTSSCLSGEIPKMLLKEEKEKAYETARWYQDVFGPENFYIEIQEHHGIFDDGQPSPQAKLNQLLYQMHKDLHIPLVATNDLHYVEPHDHASHDVLLCVQTGKQLDSPKRMRFDSKEYFLKSPAEMGQLFPELPEALLNSVRIAEQCSVDPLAYKAKLPNYTIPAGYNTQDDYLYALCLEGVKERFGEMNETIQHQLDYEFNMIAQKGFVPYFLIEWDFVNYARSHGIRCSARGSAAGSVLAYTLGITNVDPIRYQLPFERFFNTERADMPDIDMDFPDDRREDVIEYVTNKYGNDCVAQMVTFNTMAAKAAVKDVARVMGQQDIGDRITRLIPTGPKVTLQGSLDGVRELNALYNESTPAKEIIDQALKLEGSVRTTGVHAAGVIVANESLENFVPLQLRDPKDPGKGRITQYEQVHLEELGLIKFDFLGLSNLTILDNAVKFIQASRNEDINLEKIPLDPIGDPEQDSKREKSFELLASGETTGIFQLEGPKMREYIKQLKPTRVEDIMAMIALYRPGPMESIPDFIAAKHGRKNITYLDPRLAEWLEESYGIIVYQDQVLFIAVNMAGFSWGKVNKFRKALSKKKMDEVEGYKVDFIKGCVASGMKQKDAEELFTLVLPFGGYGFNKAHAASYAVVAFYTAYLKANYTAEFMAATMTTEASDAKKIANAIAECKRMGVEVLGPDVNMSARGFTVQYGGVRFGLLAIKGIGEGPIEEICRVREESGPFLTLADFCIRVDPKYVGKGAIETLIKAGGFDSLEDGEGMRHVLLDNVERAMSFGKTERSAKARGMQSLFGDADEIVHAFQFTLTKTAKELPRKQLLNWEKELIGVYVSKHPLSYLTEIMKDTVKHNTGMITEEHDRQKVVLGGMITEARRITTKKGDTMCVVKLEDMFGSIDVTVFPKVYEQDPELWQEDSVVIVYGDVQIRRDEPNIVCNRAERLKAVEEEMDRKQYLVWLTIQTSGSDELSISNDKLKVQDMYRFISEKPGRDHYEVFVVNGEWKARIIPDNDTVHFTPELRAKLEELLGKDAVEAQIIAR
ncbi:MAG: DNA polymerase III subunit alpha [Ktedonobacteraceae bacterium]